MRCKGLIDAIQEGSHRREAYAVCGIQRLEDLRYHRGHHHGHRHLDAGYFCLVEALLILSHQGADARDDAHDGTWDLSIFEFHRQHMLRVGHFLPGWRR